MALYSICRQQIYCFLEKELVREKELREEREGLERGERVKKGSTFYKNHTLIRGVWSVGACVPDEVQLVIVCFCPSHGGHIGGRRKDYKSLFNKIFRPSSCVLPQKQIFGRQKNSAPGENNFVQPKNAICS